MMLMYAVPCSLRLLLIMTPLPLPMPAGVWTALRQNCQQGCCSGSCLGCAAAGLSKPAVNHQPINKTGSHDRAMRYAYHELPARVAVEPELGEQAGVAATWLRLWPHD